MQQRPHYITLAEAANLAPGRPHPSTIWKWARRGFQTRAGELVRLQHLRVGKRIYTTEHWIDDFLAALAEADTIGPGRKRQDPAPATRGHTQAERELAEAGL